MVRSYGAAWPMFGAGVALTVLLLAGCGGGGSTGGTGPAGGPGPVGAASPGQIHLTLADAPAPGVTAVNVTISKIEALYDGEADSQARVDDDHAATSPPNVLQDDNDQWVILSTGTVTVNLLDYANKPASSLFNLASAGVPSGHYKKFRITINAVDVVINGGHVTPMLEQNLVEVDGECFVSPREDEALVLDFDAGASLSAQGTGYAFDPKLRLLQEDHAGSVSGTVQFQSAIPTANFGGRVELLDSGGQVVGGTTVETQMILPLNNTQAPFAIHAVPPGAYTLRVTGMDEFQGSNTAPTPVQVSAGQEVQSLAVPLIR